MPLWSDILINAAGSYLSSRIGSSRPSGDGRLRTASGQLASDAVRALQPPAPPVTEGGSYMSSGFYIPPGGFTGFAQMTPASKAALSRVGGGRRRKKRRGKKAAKRTVRRAARKVKRKVKRFAKGSAAAKRHMAKLRRMRK